MKLSMKHGAHCITQTCFQSTSHKFVCMQHYMIYAHTSISGTLSSIGSPKVAISIAVGVGTATVIGLAYLYRKNLENSPPKRLSKANYLI